MRNKALKTALSVLLVFSIVSAFFPSAAQAVTQSDIDALRKERDEIAAQREEKQAVVDQLEQEHASVQERKQAMDERNVYTQQQIQIVNDEISLYDEMIQDKAAEVEEALRLENEQMERYCSRMRAMEENGTLGFLAMLLNTSNLGELLTAIDDIGEIMESDRLLEEQYIAARQYTESVKADYEATREDLEGKKAVLNDEKAQLELEIAEATQLIQDLMDNIEARSAEVDELLAQEDEANARIERMVAELEAQRRAEEEARRRAEAEQQAGNTGGGNTGGNGGGGGGGGTAVGTGSFLWPTTTTYCTSRFGMRWHPVTGGWKSHTGLDIGAGQGAPVYASDSGTVTMASVNGGYGNCIMINHGNGYQTLYGHLSAYAVSSGQSVSRGDVIGYVGATGVVTGPHLHFEIWSGGSRIDPEGFFSGLSFAPDAGD